MWWAMFVAVSGIAIISLLVLAPPITALVNLGCQGHSPRSATIDATGARSLRVVSDRGDLEINGRTGLSEVRVEGVACASQNDRSSVIRIRLTAVRENDEIVVTVDLPESVRGGRLDLIINAPGDLPLIDITDEHGPVIVTNVRGLRAVVGNGGLEGRGISGDVDVPSLRGSITLLDIGGNVNLDEVRGAAGIDIQNVSGDVTIGLNLNGPATITDVSGDVTVANAGFGALVLERVAGDLVVEDNLRGDISHRDIGGRVQLPGDADPGS